MRDKIWYEMMHIKYGENYLAQYLYKQKKNKKRFKIVTLIFSTSGILSWSIWEIGVLPFIACIVVAIIQLLNLIENEIILSDNDMDKISELRNKYTIYFNKIEKLWANSNLQSPNELSEQEITNQFYELRELAMEIEGIDNHLNIRIIKSLEEKADIETRNYFDQYHS